MNKLQEVSFNGLINGIIVEYNGEKYKVDGADWRKVFDYISNTIFSLSIPSVPVKEVAVPVEEVDFKETLEKLMDVCGCRRSRRSRRSK